MFGHTHIDAIHEPWNKGKLIGQKQPLTLQQIWSIRMHLKASGNIRDLTLFNLGLDSKLRACDLLRLRVSDVVSGDKVQSRATIRQRKTGRPVRFEITPRTRASLVDWISSESLSATPICFQVGKKNHHTCRYASIRESCRLGFWQLDSIQQHTARTPCAAPRRR